MTEAPVETDDSDIIDIDADDRNSDWIKTLSWDLPTDPAYFTQPELEELSTLPAWEAAPEEIKSALGDESKTKESLEGSETNEPEPES